MKNKQSSYEFRKVQGILRDQSFSIVLPKRYAVNLGLGKGDFVKVREEANMIIIEKIDEKEDKNKPC
jgi:hypothetical protein